MFQSTPPSKERGDAGAVGNNWRFWQFQSTPPSKERGDHRGIRGPRPPHGFNPRPPPKRGATSHKRGLHLIQIVSIHAPLQREGRRSTFQMSAGRQAFQSTPPSKERGDRRRPCGAPRTAGFNPRPPPKRGATALVRRTLRRHEVSIHAPLQREGRPQAQNARGRRRHVSIHAPLQREGRPRALKPRAKQRLRSNKTRTCASQQPSAGLKPIP